MPITIPPAFNYPSPLVAVPEIPYDDPREGKKIVNCEVIWGVSDGGKGCINFNLQNNATLEFSQIAALVVDNSACGADLEFVFPDTGATIEIPAYSPYNVIPVFSHQTNFFLIAIDTTIANLDKTRFQILNYRPMPVSVPVSLHQNAAALGNIDATATGITQVVPATVSGTLENLTVFAQMSAGAFRAGFDVQDGDGVVLADAKVVSTAAGPSNALILNLTNLHLRFHNGIQFNVSSTNLAAGSTFACNAYYRLP